MKSGDANHGVDGINPEDSPASEERLTAQAAKELVDRIPPHTVVQALNGRDFAAVRSRIFAGFRVKPETLKSPLARGRLISELIMSEMLVDKINELASSGGSQVPSNISPQLPKSAPTQHKSDSQLSSKITELQRELRNVRAELKSSEASAESLQQQISTSQNSSQEAQKQIQSLLSKLEWSERQRARLDLELAAARRQIHHVQPKAAKAQVATLRTKAINVASSQSAFADAIERLISSGKIDTAWSVVDEALRAQPSDIVSLKARALLQAARGDKKASVDDLTAAFEIQRQTGQLVDAAVTVYKAVSVGGDLGKRLAESLYATLARDPGSVAAVAGALASFEGTSIYAMLRLWCKPPLLERLFRPDDPLPGSDISPERTPIELFESAELRSVTAVHIVKAIDKGDVKLISNVRSAISKMPPDARQALERAIARFADESYLRTLTVRSFAGAAIVDASNVANYELEYLGHKKASLANILSVRRSLRSKAYFPILLIADANLPFVVDEPKLLREMAHSGEMELVESGTDADEVIVREALRRSAVVVTNDYMADWDKDDAIHKVQYSVSMTDGTASLYF